MYLRSAILSLAALTAAKEIRKDEVKAAKLYDSGIRHANNIALKKVVLYNDFCVIPCMLTVLVGVVGETRSCGRLQFGTVPRDQGQS